MTAPVCASPVCGQPRKRRADGGWVGAHGWCGPCTWRWYRAGCPASGPPPPMGHAQATALGREVTNRARREAAREQMAEYARLRRDHPVGYAAWQVGISVKWARERYEPAYRQALRAGEAAA